MTRFVAAALAASTAISAPAAAREPTEAERQARREARAAERAERAERYFVSIWHVEESDAPLGPLTVRDGDYVFRNRLLPSSLVRLTADAVDQESGELVAEAGTQLFGLSTRGAPIYCVAGRREASALTRILLSAGNRQICFVDLDKDGRLDGHFSAGNAVRGVPNFSGHRPRNPKRLATPASYRQLRPEEMETDYFVGVRYRGRALLNSRPVFTVTFGTLSSRESLTSGIRGPRELNARPVSAMGGEFVITGREGSTLQVDIRRKVPPQPFHVIQTVTYSFY
jgi:hypothetical protein